MQISHILAPLQPLNVRLHAIERVITRHSNMLIFLVVLFVLMSGMVVSFTWCSLNLSP
jgi:hypothetical protein